MKRRTFTTVAATAPIALSSMAPDQDEKILDNEIYELRQYELAFFDNKDNLLSFIKEVLFPTLAASGANHTYLFKEMGDAEPTQIWVLISYSSMEIYQRCQNIVVSQSFIDASSKHMEAGKSFHRYTSSLLSAFDGIPQMRTPAADHTLFELRIYEGVNEDAVRRKVMMFDDEELPLFDEVGLNSIFFGKMLVGPYMPNMVYMLGFNDMEERQVAWQRFLEHPDWIAMLNKPIYKDTVSNIRKIFLEKLV